VLEETDVAGGVARWQAPIAQIKKNIRPHKIKVVDLFRAITANQHYLRLSSSPPEWI